MTRCIIVEDEVRCTNVLKSLIKSNNWLSIEVLAVLDNIVDAVQEINERKPDLLFLDIELKDGSSLDIFDKLIHRDFQAIFTTAFDIFALNAFKYSALDYLLKPIDNDEFKQALEKFSKLKKDNSIQEKIENATQLYKSTNDWKTHRIAIRLNKDVFFERLEHIVAFKASGAYTEIYTQDGKRYLTIKNLGFYEGLAANSPHFIRVHHSTIVNLDYIKSLHFPVNSSNAYITMKDKTSYEVSNRKLPQIKELLNF
jgi:two-component system LytT family response regulator